jgi:hypothetical protein
VLRGRFEEFFGPDIVLMWLHLAHPGLCGEHAADPHLQ